VRQYTLAGDTSFDHQLAAVVAAIGTRSGVPTGGEDAIANMRVIDRIYECAAIDRSRFGRTGGNAVGNA
jgi:predicted dehydrogenase